MNFSYILQNIYKSKSDIPWNEKGHDELRVEIADGSLRDLF
jgi:hypothetical protein